MAPPLRATAEAESSSAVASLAATIPASTQADDLIVVIAGASSSNTFAALSGFTSRANERAGSAAFRLGVWTKVATGTEGGTSVTPALSTGTGRMIVQVRVYHSVDPADPLNAAVGISSSDTESTNVVAPAVTTDTDDGWTVSVHGQPTTSGTTMTSWTDPSGANNELVSCSTDGTGNQAAVSSYDYDTGAAGSYGPYTAVSGQSRRWAAVTLGLNPGAASIAPRATFEMGATATTEGEHSRSPSAAVELSATAVISKEISHTTTAVIELDATATIEPVQVEDLEITILAARDDGWRPTGDETLVAKYLTTGDQRVWRLNLDADGGGDPALAGRPMFIWSTDGTLASNITAYATDRAPIDPYGRVHLRVHLDVNNGAGGWTVTFEYLDGNGEWQLVGEPVTGDPPTLLNPSSTADLTVGAYIGDSGALNRWTGRIYSLQVRVGRTGEILASPDFTNHPAGTETFTDAQGNVWDVHAPASLTSSQTLTSVAILGPLATDECATWTDFTLPRSGVGRTCDHEPDECCSYYRARTIVQSDGSLLVSDWSADSGPELFCLTWDEDEHLIRTTGPDGPMYAVALGKFDWNVDRPFTAATGVNGTRFVTSAPPGGRNLSMVAAVESEAELAELRAVLARPLVLISPSDASEVWGAPVQESVRIVKVGRIRQVTASFIGTGPEPPPQIADVGT
jgi:hypothetical protein